MKIWVDADACPTAARDILIKAANRTRSQLSFVANKRLRTPNSPWIQSVLVPSGDDVADQYILDKLHAGDLVITADVPLAAAVLKKQGHALNPRGTSYTKDNIAERLGMRDFLDELRADGITTGGPPPLSQKDLQSFANGLDRILTRLHKQ